MAANDDRPAEGGGAQDIAARNKTVKACPICGKPRDPAYAPFCSRRCADVDLHRWLKGSYVVPGLAAPEADGGDE